MHTFQHVLRFVSDLMLSTSEPETDKVFKLDTGYFANVFVDSDGHIQVCMYEDEDLEEEADGGGICIMEDEDEESEGTHIRDILMYGKPRQILELIEEKALFIWELMGRGVGDFSSHSPVELVTKRTDRVSYKELAESIRDNSFVSARISEAFHTLDLSFNSHQWEYCMVVSGPDSSREMFYSDAESVIEKLAHFELSPASLLA